MQHLLKFAAVKLRTCDQIRAAKLIVTATWHHGSSRLCPDLGEDQLMSKTYTSMWYFNLR